MSRLSSASLATLTQSVVQRSPNQPHCKKALMPKSEHASKQTSKIAVLFLAAIISIASSCVRVSNSARELMALGTPPISCDTTSLPPKDRAVAIRCMIMKPPVWRRLTDYKDVHFRTGDSVFVTAGGCAQAGATIFGQFQTWHDFVSPVGDRSERLYFGTIWIPGVTIGLEPLRSVARRSDSDPKAQYLLPDT